MNSGSSLRKEKSLRTTDGNGKSGERSSKESGLWIDLKRRPERLAR
jgi:hypothetical protein